MQHYIDKGVYTVPLSGELTRLPGGKKTVPTFSRGWKEHYSTVFNKTATDIGGALTGKASNILAIDCDNEATWQIFRSLDPDYSHVLLSEGKGFAAGTLIYTYDQDLAETFKVNNGTTALDFFSDGGFIYLATPGNKTKVPLSRPYPSIGKMPPQTKSLLLAMHAMHKTATTHHKARESSTSLSTYANIAPLANQYIASSEGYDKQLFRVLTPHSFRDLEEYVSNGYLMPDSVPQGRGSEYLSKVSAILGKDNSVSQELYHKVMHAVNAEFSDPMSDMTLDLTIIDPMLSGKAEINGEQIWDYDEAWDNECLMIPCKNHVMLEPMYDATRQIYYVLNRTKETHTSFSRDTDMWRHLKSTTIAALKPSELQYRLPNIKSISLPILPYGISEDKTDGMTVFNTFKTSYPMQVLLDPTLHKAEYIVPETTLSYLRTLVPDDETREYMLSFIKTKMQTLRYSPVILYFIGVQGSGKDVFVNLLSSIIGDVARPSSDEFLEKANGWALDATFVHLDEFGDSLKNASERRECLGKLKTLTGSSRISMRLMRTDSYTMDHRMTFIMTTNKNAFMLEDGDRRILAIETPNVLVEQDWVYDVSDVVDKIKSEVADFAYYLATEVESLKNSEYVKPPETESKAEILYSSSMPSEKVIHCMKYNDMERFRELCDITDMMQAYDTLDSRGEILLSDLTQIVSGLMSTNKDFEFSETLMRKAVRSADLNTRRTTHLGENAVYIVLHEGFKPYEDA